LAEARQILEHELQSIRDAGTFKRERVITSKQAVSVQVQGQTQWLLNFCANNYLGLSVIKQQISTSKIRLLLTNFARCRATQLSLKPVNKRWMNTAPD
jgi:7-keto-8-aminopelargonate synthetase-like enzyme